MTVGSTVSYTYDDGNVYIKRNWQITNGTINSTSFSGTANYCSVTWSSTCGSGTLTFRNLTTVISTLNVTINPTLTTPTGTFTTTQYCRYSTITRNGTPPTGELWYWQTSSSGTSTSNSTANYDITAAGYYYLRAYACGAWSTSSLSTGHISGPIDPAAPTSSNYNVERCGPGTVALNAIPGSQADNIRWYAASTGGTALATGTSYTTGSISSTTNYYAASLHTATNCESLTRTQVTATVKTIPNVVASNQAICSGQTTSIAISTSNGAPSPTYTWTVSQSNVTDGAPCSTSCAPTIAQTLSATAAEGTSTYAITPSSTNGCTGSATNVVATVTAIPVVTLIGLNPIVHGSPTQLSTTSFHQYQWKNNAGDISGATSQSYTVPGADFYRVNVKSSSGSAWCLSTDTTITTTLGSQGVDIDMVSTTTVFKEGVTDASSLYILQGNELSQINQYSDGIGRLFQTVATGAAPAVNGNKGDIVSHTGFGKDGLMDSTFLPYTTTTASGAIRRFAIRNSSNVYDSSEQYKFYQGTSKVASDTKPYGLSTRRNAPDARVTAQSAAGSAWTGHEVTSLMTLNTTSYPVRYWKSDGTTSDNYASKTVMVAITTDENGNKVRTFTNVLGQTVLKQVELGETIAGSSVSWLDTYYIYDDYGQLKYQVPPKAVAILDGTPNLETDSDLAELIFKYTYDTRGRLIEKKEPGAVVKYMVYDIFDRLVLTQDGNLSSMNKWAYIKYDVLGRTAYTGLYTNSRSRASVQKWVDKAYTTSSSPYPEANYVEYKQSGADSLHGYSNVSFPKDSIFRLSVAYYDNYDFNVTGTDPFIYDASHLTGLPSSRSANVRGMATGSKVRQLSVSGNVTSNWIKGAVFYDSYDRVIQSQSNNHLDINAVDKSSVLYNSIRRVEKTKLTHTAQSVTTSITQRNDYDHAGRVLKTYHQVNSNTEVLAAQYEYNALGQLVDKKLHNTGGSNFLQSVDYRYNIRGWLLSINNSQLSNDSGTTNDETGDYFGMELAYNASAGTSNTAAYNGNISAIKWKTLGESAGTAGQRSYNYSYDKSDKLKVASFQAYGASAWDKEANTLNESMTYDHGGNIVSLTRKKNSRGLSGTSVTSAASTIDELTYTYTSNTNRISKVEDTSTSEGFTNGAVNGSSEYTYTSDGSANKDENKGISSISYNFLGKPKVVTYSNNDKVEYTYDAAGTKLSVKTTINTVSTYTNYIGGFIYGGSTPTLSQFSSPEGRVVKNGSNFEYQYALADHQGNTRVLFTSAAPASSEYLATYELKQSYGFVADTSKYVTFNAANHTDGGTKVFKMNQVNPVGPAKSLKVYPGDTVKTEVWAYYEAGSGYGTNSVSLAAAIGTALYYAATGGVGESTPMTNGVNSALGGFVPGGNAGDNAPAAYLNYILFDQQFKVLDAGWTRVPTSASFAKQKVTLAAKYVKEAGYYFTYLSYEDQSNNYVYFDDYKVTQVKSSLIQANEYYPYGMQTANTWTRESNVDNNFLYNGGTELNRTTQVYDLYYRNYDPVLGRFGQVDPMAGQFAGQTPYNYANGDPVFLNDPLGDCPTCGCEVCDAPNLFPPGSLPTRKVEGGSLKSDEQWEKEWLNLFEFAQKSFSRSYAASQSAAGGSGVYGWLRGQAFNERVIANINAYNDAKSYAYSNGIPYNEFGLTRVQLLKMWHKTIPLPGETFEEWAANRTYEYYSAGKADGWLDKVLAWFSEDGKDDPRYKAYMADRKDDPEFYERMELASIIVPIPGASFGKLGTVIKNPGLKITGFTAYSANRAALRGVKTVDILNTVRSPLIAFSQSGGKTAFLSLNAFVVLDKSGTVVTVYGAAQFDAVILSILSLFR